MKKFDLSLYLVTDRHCLRGRDFYEAVEEALRAGVTMLQLREKDMGLEELVAEGRKVRKLCRKYQVPFLVDDNVEAARILEADGVHLGQVDDAIEKARSVLGPEAIIGISAHNLEEALKAQASGADYLGVGALYPTGSKKDASLLAPGMLEKIVQAVKIPVVGIGGIHEAQLDQVLDHGLGVDMRHAAVRVADDHHFLHAQLHDAHQQTPYGAVKGAGDHAAGVFDELYVAVLDAQGRRQQLHQPGIHTGEDGDLLIRVFAGGKALIGPAFHKFPVVGKHFVDHRQVSFLLAIFVVFSIMRDYG